MGDGQGIKGHKVGDCDGMQLYDMGEDLCEEQTSNAATEYEKTIAKENATANVNFGDGYQQNDAIYDIGESDDDASNSKNNFDNTTETLFNSNDLSMINLNKETASTHADNTLNGNESNWEGSTESQLHSLNESHIGSRVRITGYSCAGTLRFYGNHHVKQTVRCGVELDEPIGLNNGTVHGKKYFECAAKHGVLCNPSKVFLVNEFHNLDVSTRSSMSRRIIEKADLGSKSKNLFSTDAMENNEQLYGNFHDADGNTAPQLEQGICNTLTFHLNSKQSF